MKKISGIERSKDFLIWKIEGACMKILKELEPIEIRLFADSCN